MHPYLFKGLGSGPVAIQRLTLRFDSDAADRIFDAERFTIREVIAHLADWEVLFRGRMIQALTEENPVITILDEGERAVDQEYSKRDVGEQLAIFMAERDATLAFLRGLAPSDFRRTYEHPINGQMVIEDQANMLLGHDLYHVEQLIDYLDVVTMPSSA